MDEKTLAALTALAQKFGTTAEYLWGVLIKQAAISGVTSLVEIFVWLALTIYWTRFTYHNTRKTDQSTYSSAEWEEEAAFFAWLGVFVLATVSAIVTSCGISDMLSAFINPEYWALKQILH